ncbi:cytochrome b [Marinibactrum halimedae]|uniref:Cytochrome b561 n=1 Tax=Marinibactrum halimedae TaxID=1444977 RepID=A0AA37T107_9GAMM|nr:cytochrome b/b6 domain-containing protein [Marinibactrum halimedae]MCD9457652.1 cytochrome b/b6 domain-containing protein [Marinibactrum halimedae]GLS24974.1 cytochrome b561 [Marinibactrum halimedae]
MFIDFTDTLIPPHSTTDANAGRYELGGSSSNDIIFIESDEKQLPSDSSQSVSPQSYPLPAKIFHWISAVVIIWASISGFSLSLISDESIKHAIGAFNVSITTVLIPVFFARIVYRIKLQLCGEYPAEHPGVSKSEKKMAHLGHIGLYVLSSIVLVTGVLMMQSPIEVFYVFQIPNVITDSHLAEQYEVFHSHACRALAGLIIVHVLAVIWHRRQGRCVLKRMV